MSERSLHTFRGGIRLSPHKERTQSKASWRLPIPEKLFLPLQQHVGFAARPCVTVGQTVLKGDLIADNDHYVGMRLHAPSSGIVSAVAERPVIHPSGGHARCIEITTDGEDTPGEQSHQPDETNLDAAAIYRLIARAGIVGLGGAGFPAHVKVREGTGQAVDLLVINGVECEPYITCDDRLMQECPQELVAGTKLIARALDAKECVIAVENDMPAALEALENVPHDDIELVSVPARYPAGSEKQLITVLTGREVPSGKLPIHIGVAVLNVATVLSIYRAVTYGQPLIERMLTVAGAPSNQGNVLAMIGTPVQHILEQTGLADASRFRVLSGGPMMGTVVHDMRAPITKTVNCILVLADNEVDASACIRCGDCVPVCPVGLQPQQLFEAVRIADLDAAQDFHLFDCIDCGCCAYVCPSKIPLVHYYRYAKSSIESLDRDRAKADYARSRNAARQARLGARSDADYFDGIELADLAEMNDRGLQSDIEAAVSRVRLRRREDSND